MKVSLDETGCLKLSAETPLESYALRQWSDNYSEKGMCDSILLVEPFIRDEPLQTKEVSS